MAEGWPWGGRGVAKGPMDSTRGVGSGVECGVACGVARVERAERPEWGGQGWTGVVRGGPGWMGWSGVAWGGQGWTGVARGGWGFIVLLNNCSFVAAIGALFGLHFYFSIEFLNSIWRPPCKVVSFKSPTKPGWLAPLKPSQAYYLTPAPALPYHSPTPSPKPYPRPHPRSMIPNGTPGFNVIGNRRSSITTMKIQRCLLYNEALTFNGALGFTDRNQVIGRVLSLAFIRSSVSFSVFLSLSFSVCLFLSVFLRARKCVY